MISEDCKDCEFLDESNKDYPCTFDNPCRCTILKKWVDWEKFRRLVKL